MSSFTKPLLVSAAGAYGKWWKTERDFEYHVGAEGSKEVIIVKKGFLSDMASTQMPRLLLPQCAVLHDWNYQEQKYSRKRCDEIFLESMSVMKVNPIIKWSFYLVVRLFGFIPYYLHGRHRK